MAEVIYRGTLTKSRLEELAREHLKADTSDKEWNPEKNSNVISIVLQPDGNYKGFTQKNGVIIEVREGDPTSTLTRLITYA